MKACRWLPLPLAIAAFLACGRPEDLRPTIRFLSPADDATLATSSFDVRVAIDGFTLDPQLYDDENGRDPKAFRGHWHLYLDGFFQGDQFAEQLYLTDRSPGTYVLAAELVNQNHVPVQGTPPAFATVTIPDGSPSLSMQFPEDGETYRTSSLDLTVAVGGFVLDTAGFGAADAPGRGHVHVYRDAVAPENLIADEATALVTITDLDASELPGNRYVLLVALATNDHDLLEPSVVDRAAVTLPADSPRVHLTSPVENAIVGSSLGVTVTVENFSLVAPGGANVAGQGHFHVLVDGTDLGEAFASSAGGFAVAPGPHKLRLELRQNDHSGLAPPVVDKVSFSAQ